MALSPYFQVNKIVKSYYTVFIASTVKEGILQSPSPPKPKENQAA